MNGLPQGALGLYEGAFASRIISQNLETLAPFASAPAGPGGFRAGPGGVLEGRFAWGYTSGLAFNSLIGDPTAPRLGVLIPLQSVNGMNGGVIGGPARFGGPQAAFTWHTWDVRYKAWRMREGIVCTLMPAGNFWLKFAGGANYGDTVYASVADGQAISGAIDGAVETPFKVCSEGRAGALCKVSSTAKFY